MLIWRFGLESKLNIYKRIYKVTNYAGATHGDELCYIFRCKFSSLLYDDINLDDKKMIRRMSKLWANFAKYG